MLSNLLVRSMCMGYGRVLRGEFRVGRGYLLNLYYRESIAQLSWCLRRECSHWLSQLFWNHISRTFGILVLQLMVRNSLDLVCILEKHWCWCHCIPSPQNLHTSHICGCVALWQACSLTSSAYFSVIPYIHSSWPWSCQWCKWIYALSWTLVLHKEPHCHSSCPHNFMGDNVKDYRALGESYIGHT